MRPVRTAGYLILTILVTGCGAPGESTSSEDTATSTAALGSSVTNTVTTGVVCSDVTAFYLFADLTYPGSVAPGESFPFSISFRLAGPIFGFASSFAGSATLAATDASPAAPVVPFAPMRFEDRQVVTNFGAGSGVLTAAPTVGSPVTANLVTFDYTITPDDPVANNPVDAHCTTTAAFPSELFTVPIVWLPRSKDDCKKGGYETHTDEAGAVFKNQGACIKFVH